MFRMKSVGTLLLLVASTFAYDAVIFSSSTKITKDSPALTSLVASASSESPLVFFVNPDFVLGQFSKAAAAYSTRKSDSSIVNAAKAAKYAESRFITAVVHAPSSSRISFSSPLEKGQSIYLVSAENWSSLDKLAAEVLTLLGDKATFVVTNADAVSTDPARVKRVARADALGAATDSSFPIVIPKVENEADRKPCLFYLEGLNFFTKGADGKYLSAILRDDGNAGSVKKYGFEPPICPDTMALKENGPQTAQFSFTISPGEPNKELDKGWDAIPFISMKLSFTSTIDGYWSLTAAELMEPLEVTFTPNEKITVGPGLAQQKSIDYIGMNSVFSFSWNCWDSQALFFGDKSDKQIGVAFHGIQVAVYGQDYGKDTTMSYFGSKVDSCTGTFSAGSWMGIITSLVLIAVFIFGFLMLNSVQTLDRYDDPKQKQILINVRE